MVDRKKDENRKVLKLTRSVNFERICAEKKAQMKQGVSVEIRGDAPQEKAQASPRPYKVKEFVAPPKMNAHVRPEAGRKMTEGEQDARKRALQKASAFLRAKEEMQRQSVGKEPRVVEQQYSDPVAPPEKKAVETPKKESSSRKQYVKRQVVHINNKKPGSHYQQKKPHNRRVQYGQSNPAYQEHKPVRASFLERASLKGQKIKKVIKHASVSKKIAVAGEMTVREISAAMAIKSQKVILWMRDMGVKVGDQTVLDVETVVMAIEAMNHEAIVTEVSERKLLEQMWGERKAPDVERAPVLAIMGHVDHGKTTLVDALCKTRRVSKESGGITQDVRGYTAEIAKGKYVTLIDTPGHEAFQKIRARGARIVDMVLLIVAADDGPKPQTEEAISYLKEHDLPFIVVITKIDKSSDTQMAINELMRFEIIPESMGGDHLFVEISAATGQNLDDLKELILLKAEELALKANENSWTEGVVLDSQVSKGLGVVSSVLIQDGVLSVGDFVVVDHVGARVRGLRDVANKAVKKALPSQVVMIVGLPSAPRAGASLVRVKNTQSMQDVLDWRQKEEEKNAAQQMQTLSWQNKEKATVLPLIIKADAQGSVEALQWMLKDVSCEEWSVKIVQASVGDVVLSTLDFADTTQASIVMFNVNCARDVENRARKNNTIIFEGDVIYEIEKKLKEHLKSLCAPKFEEIIRGKGEIIQVFDIAKYGRVAGCAVQEGVMQAGLQARIIRKGEVLCLQKITSLRKEKEEMKEVGVGFNCGIFLEGFEGYEVGDTVECVEVRQVL